MDFQATVFEYLDYRLFLKDKGLIHLKTDNTELYNFTKTVVNNNNLETIFSTNDLYSEKIDNILSIRTHYERIFLDTGLKINYLSFRLDNEKIIQNASSKAKKE